MSSVSTIIVQLQTTLSICRHVHLETNMLVAWWWIEQRRKTLGERTWECEGRLRQMRWGKNNTMESSSRIDPAYQLQVSLLKHNPDPMVLWKKTSIMETRKGEYHEYRSRESVRKQGKSRQNYILQEST